MPDREREEEESGGFKVTDRRLFTPDGQRRADVETEPPKPEAERPKPAAGTSKPEARPAPRPPEPSIASETAPSPAAYEPPRGEIAPEPQGPVNFEQLVMSLATTAMFQLGLVKSPQDESPGIDLVAAKETIDLLDILQQKTKGNLTPQEEALLTGSLYELRMVFVDISTKAGRAR